MNLSKNQLLFLYRVLTKEYPIMKMNDIRLSDDGITKADAITGVIKRS